MSEIYEATVEVFGGDVDAFIEYDVDLCPKDRSVGIMSDEWDIVILKVVTENGRDIKPNLSQKEIARISALIAESEAEDARDRREGQEEDAWEARREAKRDED